MSRCLAPSSPTLEFKLHLNELQNWLQLCVSSANGTGDAPNLTKTLVTRDDKECFLVMPCHKLIKDEMTKLENAYYKPGTAIPFETEKTMFPYVSKEFNVRTTGEGATPHGRFRKHVSQAVFDRLHHMHGIFG